MSGEDLTGLPDHRPYLAFEGFVAKSEPSLIVADLVRRLAGSSIPVLLTGESGTGKTTIAEVLHRASQRRDRPIVVFSCAALSEEMGAAELFGLGHGLGSPAGRRGLIDQGHGGSLLLEEVTLLSRLLQQKLVTYLKYGEFQRVGESNSTAVDVRVIATATQDVGEAVASHRFSSDLFYRLSVGHIHVLPLRERREEIPALMDYFLTVLSHRHSKAVPKVPLDKLRACMDYTWPGNVRELEMRLERWIALGNKEIAPESVPRPHTVSPTTNEAMTLPPLGLDLEDYVDTIEKRLIQEALQRTGGTQTAAAMLLGLTFRQFRYKLQKFHLKSTGDTPPMHPD